MTTRKILISNEYLRLCKNIDVLLDKTNVLPNIKRNVEFETDIETDIIPNKV